MGDNKKEELQSVEKTHYLLQSSMLAKEIPPTLPKPRKPLQPEFESMDDIKPMARGIPTILKRPLPKTE